MIVPIVIDSKPDYLKGRGGGISLLALPLGSGTILSYIQARIGDLDTDRVRILRPPGSDSEYMRSIAQASRSPVEFIDSEEFPEFVRGYEPADGLLVLDPQYWPYEGFELSALVASRPDARWAVHAVMAPKQVDGMQEYVRCDDQGRIRRIRRYYDSVTWSRTEGIPYSLVPISAAEDIRLTSLTDLRSELAQRRILSQDVPLCSGVANLNEERILLSLAERITIDTADKEGGNGSPARSPGVLVGKNCKIHPSARLVGPVIVQNGAVIKEEATIVGPAVLGEGAKIGRGATILQSAVLAGVEVPDRSTFRHELVVQSRRIKQSAVEQDSVQDAPSFDFAPPEALIWQQGQGLGAAARHPRPWYPFLKRAFDATVAFLSLLVLSPLMLGLAALVKLTSPGSVFFGHEREGKDGKVFSCLKFRTMCEDAHRRQRGMIEANQMDGPQFKVGNDPRVTLVGQWLRATNLDELPQLINILRGQMSLVGPRPSPFRENQICVPWRRARLSVRPGITGLWQICRHDRDYGDFHQWIAYDTRYVVQMSGWLDFKLLLATVLTLGGKWSVPEGWILNSAGTRSPAARPSPRPIAEFPSVAATGSYA